VAPVKVLFWPKTEVIGKTEAADNVVTNKRAK
jgi:hypothetical protein